MLSRLWNRFFGKAEARRPPAPPAYLQGLQYSYTLLQTPTSPPEPRPTIIPPGQKKAPAPPAATTPASKAGAPPPLPPDPASDPDHDIDRGRPSHQNRRPRTGPERILGSRDRLAAEEERKRREQEEAEARAAARELRTLQLFDQLNEEIRRNEHELHRGRSRGRGYGMER